MPITLHGIANCDTVKRARAWLAAQGADVQFHDFKKTGVPAAALDSWVAAAGWEHVLNRQGNTWRGLDDAARTAVVDAASAKALMLAHTSATKRPVVVWANGAITVGFDEAQFSRCLGV